MMLLLLLCQRGKKEKKKSQVELLSENAVVSSIDAGWSERTNGARQFFCRLSYEVHQRRDAEQGRIQQMPTPSRTKTDANGSGHLGERGESKKKTPVLRTPPMVITEP